MLSAQMAEEIERYCRWPPYAIQPLRKDAMPDAVHDLATSLTALSAMHARMAPAEAAKHLNRAQARRAMLFLQAVLEVKEC